MGRGWRRRFEDENEEEGPRRSSFNFELQLLRVVAYESKSRGR